MEGRPPRTILVAGAGIGGLTAALAFAERGFRVEIFERVERFEAVGAGIQLSPNATRILGTLGVLGRLAVTAAAPEAVVLKDGKSLKELARVPLGKAAETRWKAPYLVAHRADLHTALLARASEHPGIRLHSGSTVAGISFENDAVAAMVEPDGRQEKVTGALLIAADGVWSGLRHFVKGSRDSRPTGTMAWRTLVETASPAGRGLVSLAPTNRVTAFLNPALHMVVYPLRGGTALNLVALTKGEAGAGSWTNTTDTTPLAHAMRGFARPLADLAEAAKPWTAWPIHTVDPNGPWTDPRGLALVGDAAHAMTPFAAQGAAMAIEDASALAALVAGAPNELPAALARYEAIRRPRIRRVVRRGVFNHFTWHVSGPVALARNLVLAARSPDRLAADFDWLYGWKTGDEADLTRRRM
ncbi:MAG: FAD-dependent monooxygenase [Hyphomicrobiales bacterium]|nr:FAD-dependent monooxygenase [Hyphomicrobiales bacterium]